MNNSKIEKIGKLIDIIFAPSVPNLRKVKSRVLKTCVEQFFKIEDSARLSILKIYYRDISILQIELLRVENYFINFLE